MESELDKFKSEKQKFNIRDLELHSYEVCSIISEFYTIVIISILIFFFFQKTLDEMSQKVKEEKLHSQNLEQELLNANKVIDSLHEQIKHLEHIVITEQERNKQNSVSLVF